MRLIFLIEGNPYDIFDGIDVIRPDGTTEPVQTDLSLVLNPDGWKKLAAKLGLDAEDIGSLQCPKAIDAVLHKLAALLGMFPGYAQIHAVYLTCEPWSIENGLLTPTFKIKRSELEKHFAREINELYRGHVLIE